MAKKYFKSFGTSTTTTTFESSMFGLVAGTARACGCDCMIVYKLDELDENDWQVPVTCRAILTGTDAALDELIYRLWEKWGISEEAA